MTINLPTHNEYSRATVVLLNDLARLGVTLPKPVADALKTAQRTLTTVANFQHEGSDDALADLFTSLLAGGDDLEPETLTRTILAAVISGRPAVREKIGRAGTESVQAAVRDNGPAIVKALRPRFEKAAAELDAAAKVLGDRDLNDLPAITALGGDAAEHWKRATAAEKVISEILTTLWRLSVAGGYPREGDQRTRVLAVADLDLKGYKQVNGTTRPWDLRRHGRLALADAEEFNRRNARIESEWQTDPANPITRIPEGVGQLAAAYNAGGVL